ncbi:hypothetical protein [Microbacterium sp. NPDC058389]|uniref:hypothetical protein n=1 Tax=Microbacterium sp. NPDC058389 TaxID=3346475 RepID=UPI00365E6D13
MIGRALAVVAVLVAVVAGATACTADGSAPSASASASASATASPRPVSGDEAERLAVARLRAYEARVMALEARVPVADDTLQLTGRVDLRAHDATAVVETGDGRWALLQWTQHGKALVPLAGEPDGLPDPPADGWQVTGLVPDEPLDGALTVVLSLASDRAENPLLLRQNGAQFVRADTVDGVDVDVFLAPGADERTDPRIRYWVDAEGLLRRVDADTGYDDPLVITLTPVTDAAVPVIPELQALAG